MKHFGYRILFSALTLCVLTLVLLCARAQSAQDAVAEQVLRLHIVANSDSDYDQAIKLKVRDRILTDCGYLFAGCRSADDAAARAGQNLVTLRQTAEKELLRLGVLQPVSVRVGIRSFPTKEYGGVRLPAGRYQALSLYLGSGRGHNWWCVMYPPLCLTGGTVQADEATLASLRETLSAENYALVTEQSDLRIQTKFKLAELLGSLRRE